MSPANHILVNLIVLVSWVLKFMKPVFNILVCPHSLCTSTVLKYTSHLRELFIIDVVYEATIMSKTLDTLERFGVFENIWDLKRKVP